MPKLFFAWLGSGRTKRSHVGAPGRYLDQAARAGLPVPAGAVLLDEFYQFALSNELAVKVDEKIVIPDPDSLHATIFESLRLPTFDRPIVVRAVTESAIVPATAVDEYSRKVDSDDAHQFASAISAAWTELYLVNADRRDVLLIEDVPAIHSGTAKCAGDAQHDLIAVAQSSAVTASAKGNGQGNSQLTLDRLSGWRLPDDSLPPHIQRLQMLLRGVRRTMEPGDWTVRWADDGAICWLVDLRQQPHDLA